MPPRFENGWVKLYRSTYASDIARDVELLGVWTSLLMIANWQHSDFPWGGARKTLPPGSIVFGWDQFAAEIGTSSAKLRRRIAYLVKTGRITRESSNQGTIVTICNWDKYQTEHADYDKQPASNQKTTNKRPTNDEQRIEEFKNLRKKEYIHASEEIEPCIKAWGMTLEKFGIRKSPNLDEIQILRLIQQYGAEQTRLALLGAGFEEKTKTFDPRRNLSIARVAVPKNFAKFVNLGAQFHEGIESERVIAPQEINLT